MADLLEMLKELGFGEYEARVYVALLQHSPVNGYELARQSGVPRGSIYGALARLEEKGAVVRLATPEGTRYGPVATEEVLSQAGARFQRTLGHLRERLAEVTAPPKAEHVWTARGYGPLLDHARALTTAAEERLLLATWPQEAAVLSEHTADAHGRGVQLRTLCLANCPQPCGHCRGHVYRYEVMPQNARRWLLLVVDGREVLAGEISPGAAHDEVASATMVRTRQPLLVGLAESYVCQSTALAAILAGAGPNLAQAISREARAALTSLADAGSQFNWGHHMRVLLAEAELPAGTHETHAGVGNANQEA
jgi:HTH-type transcriptional regulator, sugar sensing transcriptional regulator